MSLRRTFLILIALAALLAIWGYATAVSVPIVRQARLDLPRWPAGAPPFARAVNIAFLVLSLAYFLQQVIRDIS